MQTGTAFFAHFLSGRYDEALSWAQKALRERPDYSECPCAWPPRPASPLRVGRRKPGQSAAASAPKARPRPARLQP